MSHSRKGKRKKEKGKASSHPANYHPIPSYPIAPKPKISHPRFSLTTSQPARHSSSLIHLHPRSKDAFGDRLYEIFNRSGGEDFGDGDAGVEFCDYGGLVSCILMVAGELGKEEGQG